MTPLRSKSLTAAAIGSTVVAVTMLGLPSQAATHGQGKQTATTREASPETGRGTGFFDSRALSGNALVRAQHTMVADRTRAQSRYLKSLGASADVQVDPLTLTPRQFARVGGYLSGRSSKPARKVAMGFVRAHLADLGLTRADLATFRFERDYTDLIGVHHLTWSQQVRGVTVFGNGLKVNVTKHGQIVSVQGSPVSGLATKAATASMTAKVTASAARQDAARDAHSTVNASARVATSRSGNAAKTTWSNNDFAKHVWFLTPSGLRLGWSTYVQTGSGASYQHVIDAGTGRTLLRQSLTRYDAGDANVYDNYPGAAKGGKPKVVNFIKRGWLKKGASFLNGSSVVAFTDVNDDNVMQDSEKTKVPGTKHGSQFPLTRFGKSADPLCKTWFCTWDPTATGSWKKNRQEVTTNGFYYDSNFHDYLAKAPIGFTAKAGNFETRDGDPVMLNTLDGANTLNGMPDLDHIDNANMSTPPDGLPPTMQMYLFHVPGANDTDPFPDGDNEVPTTGSLDASVQYHEYTHGLSNRLVTDANGNEALDTIEAGSMGEAWSDYYAMDYLVSHGFYKDTSKPGQLLEGRYVAGGLHTVRTMAIDCPVGAKGAGCTSGFDPSVHGGYTYADFPTVIGEPEVHGSGEIWGQTLWQIRTALGRTVADTLITRAMSLSPAEPSFLDMRNAIISADKIAYNSGHTTALWKIFANRGMGYFAGATDGSDADPAADFHTPPAPFTPRTVITGTVTDPTTGDGINGAVVSIAGLSQSFGTAITKNGGRYTISGIFPGTYPKVVASAPGYLADETDVRSVVVPPEGALEDFALTRDWASENGGGSITDFNGPDFSPQCGPEDAIDTSLGKGWGSTVGDDFGTPTGTFIPKHIVVKLPQAVDVTSFLVDPDATCGDSPSSSTGDYTIEVSPDGTTWTTVAEDHFGVENRGQLNEVDPSVPATGVQFVRFTIVGDQVEDSAAAGGVPGTFETICGSPDTSGLFTGCNFADLTELAVLGTPAS